MSDQRFNTGNPIGSNSPLDRSDNTRNMDLAMNSQEPAWTDRFGVSRSTLAGQEDRFDAFIESSGYQFVGDYAAGIELTEYNQLVRDADGEFWRVSGQIDLPYTTTGTGVPESGALVSVGDAVLRQDLTNPGIGAAMVARAGQVIGSIQELRELDKASASKHAFVTGYYAQGDGGGGTYCLDSADIVSADDGGSIIVAADGGRWKLAWRDRINIDQFGARRRNVEADAPYNNDAIQRAFDSGLPLTASKGVYQLSLSRTVVLEAGSTYCALFLRSGLSLIGQGFGQTIFKLCDGESSDADPKFFNLIAGNEVYDYVYISGITFDMNGQNNPISPSRASGVYSAYNAAAIMVSGSVATGGSDARMNNSKILDCEFINSPGVTCLAVGQRYGHPGASGYNIEITGCRFYNNGLDVIDHSSVFCYANGVTLRDCVFDHPHPSTGVQGPVVAFEIHGSDTKAIGNTVRHYCQMAWISQGEDGVRSKISVTHNRGSVSFIGVALFGLLAEDNGLSDIDISNNIIQVTAEPISNPGISHLHRCGVYLGVNVGYALRVSVQDNILYCTDRTKNAAIMISPGLSGTLIQDALMSGNIIHGFSRGVWVGAGGLGRVSNLHLSGNMITNVQPTSELPYDTFGINVSGTNFSMRISENSIGSGDTSGPSGIPAVGIELAGTAYNLHMDNNSLNDSAIPITSTMNVQGRRSGRQAVTFPALPEQGAWRAGDVAYLSPPVILGVAPDQYIVEGWQRITTGTSNVLGSDWVERRLPTGT